MRLVPIRKATAKERKAHAAYIRKTPVGWLHILLEHGAPYWIAQLDELGSAKTIFRWGQPLRLQAGAEAAGQGMR